MLQRFANGETYPEFVVVAVGGRTDVDADPPLEEFMESVGGEEIEKYTWRVPTGHMLSVVQRPDAVGFAQPQELAENKPDRYPTLDDTLEDIVAAFEGGITAERAAWYALNVHGDSVLVEMQAPDTSGVSNIRAWLTDREVYVPPAEDFRAFSDYFLAALVPLELLTALAGAFPDTYFSATDSVAEQLLPMDRAHWPPEALEFEAAVVSRYLPEAQTATPMPAPTFTPAPSPTPAPTATVASTPLETPNLVGLGLTHARTHGHSRAYSDWGRSSQPVGRDRRSILQSVGLLAVVGDHRRRRAGCTCGPGCLPHPARVPRRIPLGLTETAAENDDRGYY